FKPGEYSYGKGKVYIMRNDPKEFVLSPDRDNTFIEVVKNLYDDGSNDGELKFKNYFTLSRGPYEIISVVDEGVDDKPYVIKGKLIDLFDPEIPVLTEKVVNPGEQALLYNIERVQNAGKAQVLAAAARIYDENAGTGDYTFVAKSPLNTTNVMRILLPDKPNAVEVKKASGQSLETTSSWDENSKTYFL